MALTVYQTNPEVVELGGAKDNLSYIGDDSATFKKGELIRINTSGQVVVAALDSDTDGAVHGMALENVDVATTDIIPIKLFSADTVLRIQLNTGTPADVSKGTKVALANSSNKWAATATTTKGIASIVAYEADSNPFSDATGAYNTGSDVTYGFIRVKFAQAILDAYSA